MANMVQSSVTFIEQVLMIVGLFGLIYAVNYVLSFRDTEQQVEEEWRRHRDGCPVCPQAGDGSPLPSDAHSSPS